jgi:hypothetical protein
MPPRPARHLPSFSPPPSPTAASPIDPPNDANLWIADPSATNHLIAQLRVQGARNVVILDQRLNDLEALMASTDRIHGEAESIRNRARILRDGPPSGDAVRQYDDFKKDYDRTKAALEAKEAEVKVAQAVVDRMSASYAELCDKYREAVKEQEEADRASVQSLDTAKRGRTPTLGSSPPKPVSKKSKTAMSAAADDDFPGPPPALPLAVGPCERCVKAGETCVPNGGKNKPCQFCKRHKKACSHVGWCHIVVNRFFN